MAPISQSKADIAEMTIMAIHSPPKSQKPNFFTSLLSASCEELVELPKYDYKGTWTCEREEYRKGRKDNEKKEEVGGETSMHTE